MVSPLDELGPATGRRIHVIGAGLIGLSIALAWHAKGGDVTIEDIDVARAKQLADRYGWPVQQPEPSPEPSPHASREPSPEPSPGIPTDVSPEIVVVAVPPAHSEQVLLRTARLYLNATVIDVAAVKMHVQGEVETSRPILTNVVLTHPLAGNTTQGPAGADAALFTDRVWLLTPSAEAESARIAAVERFVRLLGGVPIRISADRHDAALATTSHLPQLTASALASLLPRLGDDVGQLAGPGLVDMTRLAASPTQLWVDIALANRVPIGTALDGLIAALATVRSALDTVDDKAAAAAVASLLDAGRDGRSLLAAKHPGLRTLEGARFSTDGSPTAAPAGSGYVWVEVHLRDEPGQLAAVLAAAAEADVNVEDVRLEHATHAAAGTLSLAVAGPEASRLRVMLDTKAL